MRVVGLIFITIFGFMLLLAPFFLIPLLAHRSEPISVTPEPVAVVDITATEEKPERRELLDNGNYNEAPANRVVTHDGSIGMVEIGVIGSVILCWGLLITLSWKMISGPDRGKERELNQTETRMIQEIYRGLSSMEQRIESLETILIERYKNRPVPFE
ncbi:MAG: hypothetical protein KC964_01255 [Candidatus Omnitrophica bacterium]|nr:hypothetical protein [Candidatus Omnitrophota bacterium]